MTFPKFRRAADPLSWVEERDLRRAQEEEADEALRLLRGVRRVEIRSRRLVQELFSGEYHSAFKGLGIEFAEVREYAPGDDVRMIDRNVSARLRRPFVKIFQEERELTVVFVIDQSGSMRFGARRRTFAETAAELTAVLGFSAVSNHDKVGCLLFSDRARKWIPPRKGRQHALRVVREVLSGRSGSQGGTNLTDACATVARALKRRSIVFFISEFLDAGYEQALALAARRHEVVPLVLRLPPLPAEGLVETEDLETGERILIDTSDPTVRAAHGERRRAVEEPGLTDRFRKIGVEPVFIPVDGDAVAPLHRYFRTRARRRGAGR